jgi:hypothetical protein
MKAGTTTRGLALALAATSALALQACGGGDDNDKVTTQATTPSTSLPSTTTPPTTSTTPTLPGLTPAGASLALGKAATVAYTTLGSDDQFKFKVSVDAIDKGAVGDLSNFQLDKDKKGMVPWYVKSHVTNKSGKNLPPNSDPAFSLTVVDSNEAEAQSLTLIGDFPKCESNSPTPIKASADYHSCEVYLLKPGTSIARVQWEVQGGGDPIVWQK